MGPTELPREARTQGWGFPWYPGLNMVICRGSLLDTSLNATTQMLLTYVPCIFMGTLDAKQLLGVQLG